MYPNTQIRRRQTRVWSSRILFVRLSFFLDVFFSLFCWSVVISLSKRAFIVFSATVVDSESLAVEVTWCGDDTRGGWEWTPCNKVPQHLDCVYVCVSVKYYFDCKSKQNGSRTLAGTPKSRLVVIIELTSIPRHLDKKFDHAPNTGGKCFLCLGC